MSTVEGQYDQPAPVFTGVTLTLTTTDAAELTRILGTESTLYPLYQALSSLLDDEGVQYEDAA